MKNLFRISRVILPILSIFLIHSCDLFKPPIISTTVVTAISYTTATSGGEVTDDGGVTVTARGVCWNTSLDPTTSNNKTTDGTGTGSFTSSLTGLTSGTTYYVRAYATNIAGTSYGNQVTFTTSQVAVPVLTTTAITSITQTTAVSGGNITTDNGSSVTSRGVCWGTAINPTIALSTKTTDGTGTGSFTSNLTGLQPGTLYYVRSYATNSLGTSYGNEISFTTLATVPSLITTAVSSITGTSAISGGNVTSDGGGTVTARGICWSTSTSPTITNNKTDDGNGTGTFTSSLTSLMAGTTYYVRAYATNSSGTAYGNEISFTTENIQLPTITTTPVSSVTSSSAISGGYISADGGASVTSRGVCWSIFPNPTTYNFYTTDGSGIGSFISSITGLTANTTYYIRAFATNSAGTAYGSQISFTTGQTTTLPTVTTNSITDITQTTASGGGNVTSDGNATVTARGVCWNTTSNPTTANTKTANGSGTGAFTSSLTGLTANTSYYVRAYATNSVGTAYGAQVSFTTSAVAPVVPTLTTTAVTTITQTTSTSGGNISSDGGASVTARGVCWSTSTNPTTSLSTKTTDGTGTGSFTSSLNGLTANTTYYVRAYATNSVGTAYGTQVSFTTSAVAPVVPTLTTTAVTTITQTTATSGGNISSDGGVSVTARGVCWSTSTNPTTSLSTKTTDGTGTGAFTSSLTGLTANTTYYVRAYATNSVGTAYGTQVSFTTSSVAPVVPTLTTTAVTTITQTTATSGGNITSDGGASVTARGVCWSTSVNPTIALSTKTTDGTGTGSFTSSITGLTASTTYYVRAYATNSAGTAYGNQVSFTTSDVAPVIPTLTTTAVTAITQTTATSGGNITSDGGASVTARGVCWSTSVNPTISLSTKTTDGSGTGSFTSSLTGLTANTTYYVRAYATNSVGTAYGTQVSFTTNDVPPVVPTLTTNAVTTITQTTATSGGNISSDGGASVTARGVCWSTSANPTTSLSTKTTDGTGTGAFTSSLTGLTANTSYYVRAYATNSVGTVYGTQVSFTTSAVVIPTLTTTAASSITSSTATSGGNISSDGGASVTARGVCWNTTSNPTISLSTKTTNGTGTGAFTSSLTGLTANTSYYIRAYATNSAGTSYGNQISFITQLVSDVDGNTYTTVTIGSQVWMAENLKTTRYNDNTAIPMVTVNNTWFLMTTPGYCWYNNNVATYGALYNWYTVSTGKLCPTGWHVPSDAEWTTLTTYLGGESVAGGKLKETGTSHWSSPNTGATNSSGFTALPGGYRDFTGAFYYIGTIGFWWSSTENGTNYAWFRAMGYSYSYVYRDYYYPQNGLSVRCLRD
jgi:uncharacterized protein (TIGR02145 family)